ncbi:MULTISPECIES: bifunctional glutamate N-acetyltransferase/amino-acid acetyltransferase ArgJ [unclassified Cryobacterium]|uniref:bifunctional glutamate N-acetyltransferase/amino-acid acetyltransferase ArgJ n=1 Tax=unclassified Cryobacterium TaxID=2649013 RepID=UPI00106B32D6|nr:MULTISPECIES: bifunctional glutamate N-acetyltransferase/amino-acid acetyltransferase ArgJ [unclassified Cryobacterium]MDY7527209.1 bifunctional glutamate N-acetyltransferase/amino-acid acetyltransferase ArgJ [Cryobacterium sp. 10C2]MDY7557003.1 bifunctional glutamate N-acetyltransferase/amino-acid acetyltransferase ArgJ [Cryobacterium sp. 10C3]MEB0004109.1 bifunctional glutamate N-acetyltransferase/amino-acid acetyltransferase ArgJ [Cryobacterium sp. RTC2.1]MEB0200294.1 bifunctional glutama
MSVTTPAGFAAAGVTAGLKKSGGLDLAVVQNLGPLASAATVFTSNRCKANPVIWSQQVMRGGSVRAIVLNSGGANCYTGSIGFQTTHATAEAVGDRLGVSAGEVLVCSTGLIGEQLDLDKITAGIWDATLALRTDDSTSAEAGLSAARAIMTTDTTPKQSAVTAPAGWSIGGMAKGAGMLAPGLATMLVVITTDAVLDSAQLDRALRVATRITFDRLDSDGCMSTNDTVSLLGSGASGIAPDEAEFAAALTAICQDLTLQLQADAEGSAHDVAITVRNAETEADAVTVARAVSRSNLFKTAIFGNDPNWGRVLAAVGTTDAAFDPYNIDVTINGVQVCTAGEPDQPRELVDLTPRSVTVLITLHAGDAEATIWTNDLTHAYVEENSAYSS